jgi:hypothetical protein
MQPAPSLVVAGDIATDHHLYAGESDHLSSNISERRACEVKEFGGAYILKCLIAALLPAWEVHLGAKLPRSPTEPIGLDAYAVWEPHPLSRDDSDATHRVWRAKPFMGYGRLKPALRPLMAQGLPKNPDLLVLDDAGNLIREPKKTRNVDVLALADSVVDNGLILLKMRYPVAQGRLWRTLQTKYAKQLVCLVGAKQEFG